MAFTHLHVHSQYSLLDGVASVKGLVKRAKEFGMDSLALTDHGNMFGVIEFYKAATDAGIRPILGIEAYIAPGSRKDKEQSDTAAPGEAPATDYLAYANTGGPGMDAGTLFANGNAAANPAAYAAALSAVEPGMRPPEEPAARRPGSARKNAANHLILLAENLEGYRNLSRLSSLAYTEGFYFVPRIDKELLRQYSGGIIGLSACLSGEIPELILNGDLDGAERAAREYRDILGENNFFLEIQRAGIDLQERILEPIREISRRTGIPIVATSDVHYLNPEDVRLQDILMCIATRKTLAEEKRMHGCPDLHLKSPEEMALAFPDFPDAVERTAEIAARCSVNPLPEKGVFNLPKLQPPPGKTGPEYFDDLCRQGLKERYGDPIPGDILARYEKEKGVIAKMGFIDYFLIVWDMVNFAKTNGIWVGPGRGSAAGSVVSYALRITDLDPVKYHLYFERFLNEGRNEMPDIDLDFDIERREEIYEYLIKTHGREKCAKIATFGCLSAKSGIRDVGRVMAYPLADVDRLSKLFNESAKPDKGENPVAAALRSVPRLKELYDADPMVRDVLDTAAKLEGVPRQTGIHAAGMVVCPEPINYFGPLAQRGEEIFTQYDMNSVTDMALCKIDVLGLETLTIIRKALDWVRKIHGDAPAQENIPLDDPKTFAMLSRGDTVGVFQFESAGFQGLMANLKPDRFEDLIAAVAMYRPGPMAYIPSWIARKHGREPIVYAHPLMEPILGETYGILVYQEQVQALAQDLAKFTLSQGDLMRRAMGKKKADEMAKYRALFIDGAQDTIGTAVAERQFDDIAKFAEYAFNKSHSACYALLAYQTAWLKANYPQEFLAALLTANAGKTDKLAVYIEEAKSLGIKVLPPDVNESGATFTVVGKDLRFGLAGIKGVGEKAVELLEDERAAHGPFKGLYDLCSRMDSKALNKGALEALAKAGALDAFGGRRSQYVAALDKAMAVGQKEMQSRQSGQRSLFGAFEAENAAEPALPPVPEWPDREKLAKEKEAIGFYVTSHPLALVEGTLRAYASHTTDSLDALPDREPVIVGGLIAMARQGKSKKDGKPYAILALEDLRGTVEVFISETGAERDPITLEKLSRKNVPLLDRIRDHLVADRVVFVVGTLSRREGKPLSLYADDVIPLEGAEEKLAGMAVVFLDAGAGEKLEALREVFRAHPGSAEIFYRVQTAGGAAAILGQGRYRVAPGPDLTAAVQQTLGPGKLVYRRAATVRHASYVPEAMEMAE